METIKNPWETSINRKVRLGKKHIRATVIANTLKPNSKATFPGDGEKPYQRPLRCPNDGIHGKPLGNR